MTKSSYFDLVQNIQRPGIHLCFVKSFFVGYQILESMQHNY